MENGCESWITVVSPHVLSGKNRNTNEQKEGSVQNRKDQPDQAEQNERLSDKQEADFLGCGSHNAQRFLARLFQGRSEIESFRQLQLKCGSNKLLV